jgi:predicted DNA-binding transcriptional regulator AlpA
MNITINGEEFLDIDDVIRITGINRTDLYVKIKYNAFPTPESKPITLSVIRKKKLWKKSDIEAYVKENGGNGEK